MFEKFPYTNLHELNLDWIIKITKDFLEQYTSIQQVISDGEASLNEIITTGENSIAQLTVTKIQELNAEKDRLEALLQAWYDTHSQDIANQLTNALADMTTHYNGLVTDLNTLNSQIQAAIQQKGIDTLATIPSDYTTLYNDVVDLKSAFINVKYPFTIIPSKYIDNSTGEFVNSTSGTFSATDYIDVADAKYLTVITDRASIYNAFYDSSKNFISPSFAVQVGTNKIEVPSNAKYVAFSNITSDIENTILILPCLSNTIQGANNSVQRMISNGGIEDANDAEINRIYLLIDISNVANLPVSQSGTLITLARDETATTQIYASASNYIYIRTKWGTTWAAWKRLLSNGETVDIDIYELSHIPFTIINGYYISENDGSLTISTSGTFSATDYLPANGLGKLVISTNRASIYNALYDVNHNFIASFTTQVGKNVITIPANTAYFRLSNIKANLEETTIMLPALTTAETMMCNANLLSAFSNITCCGDSLTWSMVYTGASTFRQAYKTYPAILAQKTGAITEILAQAGYTPTTWWNAYSNSIAQKTNHLAIIYLGTNDGLTDTLATDAPENTDPSTWAETQTGYYARIVNAWQNVGAKVLLVKCYATSGIDGSSLNNTNKAIKSIADRFGCGIIENDYIADATMHLWPNKQGQNTNHYNDLGYAEFTQRLIGYVEFMDRTYLQNIIPL